MEGYLNSLYSQSFFELGQPLNLPRSRGWLIKRMMPHLPYYDAMGPYPLFFCENWNELSADFQELKDEIVSISLVLDPFTVKQCGNCGDLFDVFYPYKDHYILDLSLDLEKSISKNKQKNARRALRKLEVSLTIAPEIDLDQWIRLYDCLIERHQIRGLRTFSRQSFAYQLKIPKTHCFWAIHNSECVGANLYYIQGDVAYAHLSAFTEDGYSLGAPYALKWIAIQHLMKIVRWINFGGGTNEQNIETDGLDLFKRGWSSKVGRSFFCGKINDQTKYQEAVKMSDVHQTNWFPAYRDGEFSNL